MGSRWQEEAERWWASPEGQTAKAKVQLHNKLLASWNSMCQKVDSLQVTKFGDIRFLFECSDRPPARMLNEGIYPQDTITQTAFDRLEGLINAQTQD